MTDVVRVEMPLALIEQIEDVLESCAQDLEFELRDRYPERIRQQSPTQERRFQNDMEPVRKAQGLVEASRSWRSPDPWHTVAGITSREEAEARAKRDHLNLSEERNTTNSCKDTTP